MSVDTHPDNERAEIPLPGHADITVPAAHPRLTALPAFTDNCIWALHSEDRRHCLVVDPGDADVVQAWLQRQQLTLTAILITHHHADHTGGIAALRGPGVLVYGPRHEAIAGIDVLLNDADRVLPAGFARGFAVLDVPGHTRGHIAYLSEAGSSESNGSEAPLLFCGDTLFSAGCGRLFEGTPAQMHASLQRMAALPGDTLVCCAHEYTLGNLRFAACVEPANADIAAVSAWAATRRNAGLLTLPSTIARELRINPFLRSELPAVRRAVRQQAPDTADNDTFAALRRWKDGFR